MRKSQLELKEKVYLTKEAKAQLRQLKKIKRKSMAKIVIDMIEEQYKEL